MKNHKLSDLRIINESGTSPSYYFLKPMIKPNF